MSNIYAEKIEKLETQIAAAAGKVAGYELDPAVSDDAKVIAASIQLAGAQIAEALYRGMLRK